VSVSVHGAMTSWLSVKDIADSSEAQRLCQAGLHRGESEAIVLATELEPAALLMDDSDGIKFAVAAGANVIRTPGIYRLAKERRLIEAVAPKLNDLRSAGFWLRDDHYRMILKSAGEL